VPSPDSIHRHVCSTHGNGKRREDVRTAEECFPSTATL
jgi:hypothetical protein